MPIQVISVLHFQQKHRKQDVKWLSRQNDSCSSKAGHVIHVPINLYLAIYLCKSLRSVRSLKNWIVFFSKDVIHWSSNLLQKFKLFCFVCLCFFFIHQRILKKVYHSLYKNVKQHNAFIILHINVSWAANQHIIMISEGTCDSEDWKYKNRKVISYCNNILQNVCFTVFFYQINAALVRVRDNNI